MDKENLRCCPRSHLVVEVLGKSEERERDGDWLLRAEVHWQLGYSRDLYKGVREEVQW